MAAPAPYELLDDGQPVERCELLVIGCGNILRGDDAVGPVLVRHLFTDGVPAGVRVVDGGTAGMDVAFAMRGAARVVLIDAAATGAKPGTLYRIQAEELVDLPPMEGLHLHNFRWDHALSFADWLLGPHRPQDITVFLIEAGGLEPGAQLSEPVAASMHEVLRLLRREFLDPIELGPLQAESRRSCRVEITDAGYLHLPAEVAARYFPAGVLVARVCGSDLELLPLHSGANGGLLLKQRNASGDRSLLVHEVLGFLPVAGSFPVRWDDERGALIVQGALTFGLSEVPGSGRGDRGDRAGERPVGGLSGGADPGRGAASPTGDTPHRAAGGAVRGGDQPHGGPQTIATRGI